MTFFNKFANNNNPNSASSKLRKKRFELFKQLLNINKSTKILDVGGTEAIWEGTGFENNVTLLNLKFSKKTSPFHYIKADACDMHMIEDKNFDVVFSNSVIEHVGNYNRQKLFAKEIKRVGVRYWVQTPYKHFPIEPHLLFPLFQYLSVTLKHYVGLHWKYSHFCYNDGGDRSTMNLLLKK